MRPSLGERERWLEANGEPPSVRAPTHKKSCLPSRRSSSSLSAGGTTKEELSDFQTYSEHSAD